MTQKEHLALHDKQIRAIGEQVLEGMRLVIETRKDMRTTLQIQKRTDRKLETLVNTLSRGPNGHKNKSVDSSRRSTVVVSHRSRRRPSPSV